MITGVVLAKNEAQNIQECLNGLKFCDQIIVVDDNSTDDTAKIAKRLGVTVLNHELNSDFSAQHNWALEQVKSGWVLFVDADERLSKELADEIIKSVEKVEYKGFLIPRHDYMWGKQLKYGDLWGVKALRLARKGAGVWKSNVHEVWEIEGRVGVLKNAIRHYPHSTMVDFLKHINYYSTLRAESFYSQKRNTNIFEIVLGPVWRFVKSYILKFGFLDGTAGFIHAMTMAFYMFLVSGKLYLLYKGIPKKT